MIGPDEAPRVMLGADGKVRERKPLQILRASAEEIAEHERMLAAIDKESKGACVWLAQAASAAAAEAST
jgi:DNA polymerase III subunit epsilon